MLGCWHGLSFKRRETLFCEMCGAPITVGGHTIVIEGTEVVVCDRCYRRYMERAQRTRVDEPVRLRVSPARRVSEQPKVHTISREEPRRQRPSITQRPAARRRQPGLGLIERYEVVEDYAQRVRRARERLGLTQKDLAVKVKVGENVIKRIEAGTLTPSIELARRLERVLGVKLLEPVAEEYEEETSRSDKFYLTLGDIAELRED